MVPLRISLAIVATLSIGAPRVRAQQPTPAQVQQALTSPEIADQVRNRLAASGLTNEQIRARLKAAGYPDSLLDSFLPGAASSAAPGGVRAEDAMGALSKIGLIDAQAQAKQATTTAAVAEASRARADDSTTTPEIFGLDVFRQSTTQFDPLTAGPVDPSYRVGPRDVLALILTGGVESSYTLEVTPEGFVVIPQVGQVFVANMTLDQITDLLYTRLGRVYSGVRRSADSPTKFSVSVARVRTNQVFVIGDATAPGSYQISGAGTILTALYAAGGPSENGSFRQIELRRAGKTVAMLDLYDYLILGDASRDSRLQSGDVVFVPFRGRHVTVSGEVGRNAVFELKAGETLQDLMRFAGDFRETAAQDRVQIERVLPPNQRQPGGRDRVVVDVSWDRSAGATIPAYPIERGDMVTVFPVTDRLRNRVAVTGHVWRAGAQGLRPGMRLADALRAAGGLKPDAYLESALITRLTPNGNRAQLRARLRDTTGAAIDDLVLQEDDSIRVFSRSEFRPARTVAVVGAVQKPGAVPYRDGMTLRDAVLQAGGVVEGAYLREAEIARLPEDRTGGVLAQTIRVPLDSSYLFERGPDGLYLGPPGMPVQAASAPEVRLEPYDNVLIFRQPEFQLHHKVTILGEVRFPGVYSLTKRAERLSDLIQRAGGFTTYAYPDGASFFRPENNAGRVDVDLRLAVRDVSSRSNLQLVDGDSIFVPAFAPIVRVSGAVSAPASISFVRGKDMRYYIENAGGVLPAGDMSRAYVTQANGSRELYRKHWWLLPDGVPEPRAGAEIVVPLQREGERTNYVQLVGNIAQVLASLATIAIVLTR